MKLIVCCYCKNQCNTTEEIERAWTHPKKGRVTCCNSCGGYEICPECGKMWENLHRVKNALCFDCAEKLAEKND